MRYRLLAALGVILCALLGTVVVAVRNKATVGTPSVSGVVLDARTRQPLEGVYVVTRWLEQSAPLWGVGEVRRQCLARAVTRTDSQGRYQQAVPSGASAQEWLPWRRRAYSVDTYAYAPGFAHADVEQAPRDADGNGGEMVLSADALTPERRVAALRETLQRFTCEPASSDPLPIAEQAYGEAYAAACLPEPNAAAAALPALQRMIAPAGASAAVGEAPCASRRQASNLAP